MVFYEVAYSKNIETFTAKRDTESDAKWDFWYIA
jgi:hypothetical protein